MLRHISTYYKLLPPTQAVQEAISNVCEDVSPLGH